MYSLHAADRLAAHANHRAGQVRVVFNTNAAGQEQRSGGTWKKAQKCSYACDTSAQAAISRMECMAS